MGNSKEKNQKEAKWFAIYTKSRSEKKVYDQLVKKGIDAYLPLLRKLKQWSDRKTWVDEPLFRSYLFVKIADDREHLEVVKCYGVVRFITFVGTPVAIPEEQIQTIRLLLATDTEIELSIHRFQPGDQIEVKVGPLLGLRGELIEVRGVSRMVVRFEQIGQSLLMNMPANLLGPVNIRN